MPYVPDRVSPPYRDALEEGHRVFAELKDRVGASKVAHQTKCVATGQAGDGVEPLHPHIILQKATF